MADLGLGGGIFTLCACDKLIAFGSDVKKVG